MINKISFSSYKKFHRNEVMELRPITLLVGKNSSGKSSIIKLISMLSDAFNPTGKFDGIALPEAYSEISHNGYSEGLSVGATFSIETDIHIDLLPGERHGSVAQKYTVIHNGNYYELVRKPGGELYSCEQLYSEYPKTDFDGFVNRNFLQSIGVNPNDLKQVVDHIGPLRVIPDSTIDIRANTDAVGLSGEGAYQMLYFNDALSQNVSNWFDSTFGGCKMKIVPSKEDSSTFRVMFSKPYMREYTSNIINEGMGISQVLPIITRCMHTVKDSIIVVEQPELHLHPAAHSSLAHLFAQTSKINNQKYIIETHSYNVLLGLCEAVVDPQIDISPEDVIIYFIKETEKGSELKSITIDSDGTLSDWPSGVFNESYDLLRSIQKKASTEQ